MRRLYIILTLVLVSAVSCSEHRTIPRKKLAKIYYEMYLTDEAISQDRSLRNMTDSLHLYEPIFNKYGYTTDDYLYSVELYLENPDKFRKVFDKTKQMLEDKKVELEKIITYETRFERLYRWKMLDSLDAIVASEGPGKSYFKFARFFFEQLEEEPLKDSRKFSLIVDRPDLDSTLADTSATDTDSISIDPAIYDSIYRFILRPLLPDTDTTDSLVRASLDSIARDTAKIDSTNMKRTVFSDTYFFIHRPEYYIFIDTVQLSDTVDLTVPKDTVEAKVIENYGSSIVRFLLVEQPFLDSFQYVLKPNEINMSKINRTNATRPYSDSDDPNLRPSIDKGVNFSKVNRSLDSDKKTTDKPSGSKKKSPQTDRKKKDLKPDYRRRPDPKDSTYRQKSNEYNRKDRSYRQRPDNKDKNKNKAPNYKPPTNPKMTPEEIKKLQEERLRKQNPSKSIPKDKTKTQPKDSLNK